MPKQQRLRVLQRPHRSLSTGRFNLFARLPTACAELLRNEALGQHRNTKDAGRWVVSSDHLDFLPLAIEFQDSGERIYLSYNGGDVPMEHGEGT
jgi:hypothetical protein